MPPEIEIPWDWYVIRASALVGFALLYIAIFVGTVSCLPGIRKPMLRLQSVNFHCWMSLQAFIFATIHGFMLIFHKFIPFSLADVLVPFHSNFEPMLVAFGTISFYLMIILILTSYARRIIPPNIWRTVHFLNIALYAFSIFHALYLGTDLKSGLLRDIFVWANGFLVMLLIYHLIYRIWSKIMKRDVACEMSIPNNYENIRQSDPASGPQRSYQNFRRRV